MKKINLALILLLFFLQSNGQTIFKEHFLFDSKEVEYSSTTGKHIKGKFYIVIQNTETGTGQFIDDIKNCLKKKKSFDFNYYYLIVPKEFSNQKEALVLEFIKDILSKHKLADSEMNIISDNDYFMLYNETRSINRGRYKHVFLNKINSLKILDKNNSICELLN